MAKSTAAVKARKSLAEVDWAGKLHGQAQNGRRRFNPNRSQKWWKRAGYDQNPGRPEVYADSGTYTGGWW
jgi:hypothetical protein